MVGLAHSIQVRGIVVVLLWLTCLRLKDGGCLLIGVLGRFLQ